MYENEPPKVGTDCNFDRPFEILSWYESGVGSDYFSLRGPHPPKFSSGLLGPHISDSDLFLFLIYRKELLGKVTT